MISNLLIFKIRDLTTQHLNSQSVIMINVIMVLDRMEQITKFLILGGFWLNFINQSILNSILLDHVSHFWSSISNAHSLLKSTHGNAWTQQNKSELLNEFLKSNLLWRLLFPSSQVHDFFALFKSSFGVFDYTITFYHKCIERLINFTSEF